MAKKTQQNTSDQTLEKILDSIAEAVFIIDRKGKILYINKTMEKLSGYKKNDVVNKNSLNFAHPDSKKDIIRDLLTVKKRGGGFIGTYKLINKKEGIVWIESSGDKITYQGKECVLTTFRDITKIKKAEEKLKENEEKLKTIIDNIFEGILIFDFRGKILYANGAALKLIGAKTYKGKNVFDFIHPISRTKAVKDAIKVSLGKEGFLGEYRINTKGELWVESLGKKIEYNGKLANLNVIRDVTERKKQEEKIKESEERFRDIVEHSIDVIFQTDKKGVLQYVSPSVKKYIGFGAEEMIGRPFWKYLYKKDKKETANTFQNILKGKSFIFEDKVITKQQNRYIDVLANVGPLRKNNKIVGMQGSWVDISWQKKAEEKFAESEKKYKTWIDQSGDAFYILDTRGRYIYANKKAEELTGYTLKDRKGKHLLSIVPKSEYIKLAPAIKDLLLHPEKEQKLTETEIIKTDGTRVPIESRMTPYYVDGKLKGFMGMSRDITERIKQEKKIREQEKKYRYLFENSLNILIGINKSGKIIDANKAVLKSFGYTKEEIIGKSFKKFVPAKYLPKLFKDLRLELMGEKTESAIIEIKNKKGKLKPVELFSGSIPLYEEDKQIGIMVSGRDLSAEELAKKKLAEAENKFKNIYDKSPIGIEIYNSKGELVDANQACLKIFGVSNVEEIKGLKLFNDPNILKSIKSKIRRGIGISYEAPFNFEKVKKANIYKTSKSGIIYLYINITSLGKNKGYIILVQDITDKKIAAEKIEKAKQQYQEIIENSSQLFYRHDTKNILTYISPQSKKILGYAPRELMIKWTKLLTDNPINKKGIELTKKAIKTGKKQNPYLLELKHKNGRKVVVEINESPLKNKTGKVIGITGALTDISEKKKVEKQLSETEKNYKTIFNSVNNAIFIYDIKTKKILDVNQKMTEMFGYTREEALKINIKQLSSGVSPYTSEKALTLIRKAAQGKEQTFEWQSKRKNNEMFWIEVNLKKIKIANTNRILAVVTDITERKKAYQMTKIQRDLGLMLGVISDIQEMAKTALEQIMKINEIDSGGFYMLDQKNNCLELIAHQGLSKAFLKNVTCIRSSKPQFRLIMKGKQIFSEYQKIKTPKDIARKSEGFKTIAIIPLKSKGKIIGALNVASHNYNRFNDNTKNLLQLIATQLEEVITRIQNEKAIKESQEKYKILSETSAEGIVLININKKIEYVNPAFEYLSLYSKKELLKMSFEKLFPQNILNKANEIFTKLITGEIKNTRNNEYKLLRKNNEIIDIAISSGIVMQNNKITGILSTIRDITEKKQAERELEEKVKELEEINKLMVGRELKMVELKKKVEKLEEKLNSE